MKNDWIGNYFGFQGAKEISEGLKVNSSLTHLEMNCYEQTNKQKKKSTIIPEGIKWLMDYY